MKIDLCMLLSEKTHGVCVMRGIFSENTIWFIINGKWQGNAGTGSEIVPFSYRILK